MAQVTVAAIAHDVGSMLDALHAGVRLRVWEESAEWMGLRIAAVAVQLERVVADLESGRAGPLEAAARIRDIVGRV